MIETSMLNAVALMLLGPAVLVLMVARDIFPPKGSAGLGGNHPPQEIQGVTTQMADEEITLDWRSAEWDESVRAAYHKGFQLSVQRDASPIVPGQWWWYEVRMTSAISETPEIWDCGTADDEDDAKERALLALTEAIAKGYGEPLRYA